MKATVNVLCYKSKTLKNGEHPLMICVCKGGKRKYISLGISVNPNYWDFKKGKPKRNCPNREQINLLIKEQERKYSYGKILRLLYIGLLRMNTAFTSLTLEIACETCCI